MNQSVTNVVIEPSIRNGRKWAKREPIVEISSFEFDRFELGIVTRQVAIVQLEDNNSIADYLSVPDGQPAGTFSMACILSFDRNTNILRATPADGTKVIGDGHVYYI
jgi:hypothetical protein